MWAPILKMAWPYLLPIAARVVNLGLDVLEKAVKAKLNKKYSGNEVVASAVEVHPEQQALLDARNSFSQFVELLREDSKK